MKVMLDIPRVYTGLAEWAACLTFLLALPNRIRPRGPRFMLQCLCALFVQCAFLVCTEQVPIFFWIPCMIIAVFLMYLFLLIAGGLPKLTTLYGTFRAFILAEFAASLEWQMEWFFLLKGQEGTARTIPQMLISGIFMLCVYAAVFVSAGTLEMRSYRGIETVTYSVRETGAAGLIAMFTFAVSNLSFIPVNTPFSARIEQDIFSMRTLVDLGGMAVLTAFQSRINELKIAQELTSVRAMLKSQYDSYRNYQDTIDIINLKYHDLKHQLIGLRAETDPARHEAYLKAMEDELEQYKPEKQTGNHVLDAIIAGKSVRCRNSRIQFTCVADGQVLDFLHVTDICTIFGNALDNAIENTALVTDPQKRLIHMQVIAKKGFLFIRVENYCENDLIPDGEYLKTTKPAGENHGHGLRSMRYAAQKYGGTLTYGLEGRMFVLQILIPIPKEQT